MIPALLLGCCTENVWELVQFTLRCCIEVYFMLSYCVVVHYVYYHIILYCAVFHVLLSCTDHNILQYIILKIHMTFMNLTIVTILQIEKIGACDYPQRYPPHSPLPYSHPTNIHPSYSYSYQ